MFEYKYLVLGFQTEDTHHGCDAESGADTLKEARAKARYMLSEEERLASEASSRLVFVQIWRGKELIDEISN